MKTLQYKCTLLSDIILNQKAATEGPNSTLDFIPGNNFLGIVAGALYKDINSKEALELFHSGKVRFGDAHVANGHSRSLHVPADMYKPKMAGMNSKYYIMRKTDNTKIEIRQKQLKQCRSGYYDFTTEEALRIDTATNFAIKSAHDKETRTSADEKMYAYQSLQAGLEMYFSVEVDVEALISKIEKALIGKKRIGRSRSAQYGLVEIETCSYLSVDSQPSKDDEIVIYAESRLIFLDENCECTFTPTAEQLGVRDGTIDWKHSQIRTFQYAPWNYKRQCFDTDRCGIEKGSVIVVKGGICDCKSTYIGSYKNEGFGRVIYNPAFLEANADGTAKQQLVEKKESKTILTTTFSSPLLSFLLVRKEEEECERKIYDKVNIWVGKHSGKFKGDAFASQWGTIRSMAAQQTDIPIEDRLFGEQTSYLMHGTAEEKWAKGNRRVVLKEFIGQFDTEQSKRLAVINLASVMAKQCRKED